MQQNSTSKISVDTSNFDPPRLSRVPATAEKTSFAVSKRLRNSVGEIHEHQ